MIDSTQSETLVSARIHALERRVLRLRAAFAGGALAACTLGLAAFAARRPDVLRARRLVLVDSQGKPGAAIELSTATPPSGLGQSPQESGAQWLKISVASDWPQGANDSSSDTNDSLRWHDAELRLNGRALMVMFGKPGIELAPQWSSGMALDSSASFELRSWGKSVYRIDPSGRSVRPAS